jgi:hypothetical protein
MRFRRHPARRLGFRPRLHPLRRRLAQAHRWMESGQYASAAARFSELAEAAVARGRPIAAHLFLQAGRAHVAAAQLEDGRAALQQGFDLLAENRDPRLVPASQRILAELRQEGYDDLACALEEANPYVSGESRAKLSPLPDQKLPPKCPYCGGSVHTDEVDTSDPDRPACAYCGSPLLRSGADNG